MKDAVKMMRKSNKSILLFHAVFSFDRQTDFSLTLLYYRYLSADFFKLSWTIQISVSAHA